MGRLYNLKYIKQLLHIFCIFGTTTVVAQELVWTSPNARIPFADYHSACSYSISNYCSFVPDSGCVSVSPGSITYYHGGGRPYALCGGTAYISYVDNGEQKTRTVTSNGLDAVHSSVVRYVAVDPVDTVSAQQCAGNPINITGGAKLQREEDIPSKGEGQVGFARAYNNTNINGAAWFYDYQQSLAVVDPTRTETIRHKSPSYSSKSSACTSGWTNIRSSISASWATGTTASLNGDLCQVRRNGITTRNLIVMKEVYVDQSTIPPVVRLTRVNGNIINFQKINNKWLSVNGTKGTVEKIDAGNAMWRYSINGLVEEYSDDGKLLSIVASNGIKQELFYDEITGLLTRVQDATGRHLDFSFENGRLISVIADGNQITSYTYNAAGVLSSVQRPDNSTRTYHYEDARFPTYLTGITDERGVRYATWTYDAQGRAISSEHAGGTDKTLLAFNADGSTTVTNSLGKQTTYHFDDIAGARRVTQVEGHATTSCEGANQNYTYTPEGWLASKTDWKGNTTTYAYNTFGQEISSTEASGTPQARTIITEWHPNFYVKTRMVEGGKETRYTYDDNGRLLSTTTNTLPIQ